MRFPLSLVAASLVWALTFGVSSTAFARPKRKPAPDASTAPAAPTENYLRKAEVALDEGRPGDAARAFVEADDAERNMALLGRAFEAANESGEPLLIVQVSERILSRPEVSDEGRTLARRAVAQASDKLTQLELVCAEKECAFEVDGQSTPEGISYWLPGPHEIKLTGVSGEPLAVKCAARAICRFTLPMTEAAEAQLAMAAQGPTPVAVARAYESPALAAGPSGDHARARSRSQSQRLPLGVLITSSIAAGALGSLAVWSGVEALQARKLYDTDKASYDSDAVRMHARRTDYFLIGAGVSAAMAAATALWWVNWDERRSTHISVSGPASLSALHRF